MTNDFMVFMDLQVQKIAESDAVQAAKLFAEDVDDYLQNTKTQYAVLRKDEKPMGMIEPCTYQY